jgi:hypothetical protein
VNPHAFLPWSICPLRPQQLDVFLVPGLGGAMKRLVPSDRALPTDASVGSAPAPSPARPADRRRRAKDVEIGSRVYQHPTHVCVAGSCAGAHEPREIVAAFLSLLRQEGRELASTPQHASAVRIEGSPVAEKQVHGLGAVLSPDTLSGQRQRRCAERVPVPLHQGRVAAEQTLRGAPVGRAQRRQRCPRTPDRCAPFSRSATTRVGRTWPRNAGRSARNLSPC